MNTLKTGYFPVYPYTLSYTVHVTFPVYSVHEQNDLSSETVRSSFDSQESNTSFKLGLKYTVSSDDAIICDCVKCQLHQVFTRTHMFTLPPSGPFSQILSHILYTLNVSATEEHPVCSVTLYLDLNCEWEVQTLCVI